MNIGPLLAPLLLPHSVLQWLLLANSRLLLKFEENISPFGFTGFLSLLGILLSYFQWASKRDRYREMGSGWPSFESS